ncbi:MBL fold metallo-hydrolase [Knoellia sp. CPCC 206435]|uniref:MBL fold metallo-hydrolase n=1 Tax=Knoellia terrae TaxID=3404797 RepID=UPI003B43D32D
MCTSCLPDDVNAALDEAVPHQTARPDQPARGLARRALLHGGLGAASAFGLTVAATSPARAATTGSRQVRGNARTKAVLVGTAGGPIWRQAAGRRGICTVVEVDGARYLVDAGHGAAAGLFEAGMIGGADGKNDLTAFRAGFLTHLHSDHVTDLSTFLVQGFIAGGLGTNGAPFRLLGPGDRGALPSVFPPSRPTPDVFNPSDPTPGTASMVGHLLRAFGTDINDRIFDAGSPLIDRVVQAEDIVLPTGLIVGHDGPPPAMRPFRIHEDDRVEVLATLVDHGQMTPSYAYRFNSAHGSVVISGDTTLSPNLLELADGCDVLLHEVIDYDTIVASIDGLPVSEEIKEAFRNHMFGAHTTEAQLGELIRSIDVKTLVLHHVVPGDIANGGWGRVSNRLGRIGRTAVVAGEDNMVVGAS